MKILVNAVSCRVAGGLSVARNFLRAYELGDFEHELVVYAPSGCGYEELSGRRVRVEIVPEWVNLGLLRSWVDNVWLRGVVAREAPDVLFAMGSIAYPSRVPQLVLYHWPYAIYPEREAWDHMGVRDRLTRRVRRRYFVGRMRFATALAAQTETARGRLERHHGLRNVEVVPNAVSLSPAISAGAIEERSAVLARVPEDRRVLLCLTRYYPHKNLEILPEVARALRERGENATIAITVSKSEGPGAAALLRRIEREALGDYLVNLGTVPMDDVPALYRSSAALLLPTLLESFSGVYVEAMHFGRPVFTSDRDFARDGCGDVAFYFDPHDPGEIARIVSEALSDEKAVAAHGEAGRRRVASLPGWPEVAKRYVRLLEKVAGHGSAGVSQGSSAPC